MPSRSTFSHLMVMFVSVILISVLLLLGLFYLTMRDVQTENRMNALKTQAYDIAYLAGMSQLSSGIESSLSQRSTTDELLQNKLFNVYKEYDAYCMVVDLNGQGTAHFLNAIRDHSDLRSTFDAQYILSTLKTVLKGQEVVALNHSSSGPMFTVAVPWSLNGRVLGAVFIQTAAQSVRASYEELTIRVVWAAVLATSVAAIFVFVYTRRLEKPLREIATISSKMANGDFTQRVAAEGTRELQDMARAFNTMAQKLSETEQTRRDFIANISHELRSPMTNIRGFIQGLLDDTIPQEQEQHYLTIVLDETTRLTKLVSSLLNLSRMESDIVTPQYASFDINELIRLVLITNVNQLEQQQIDVQLSFEEEPAMAHADRDQIEQVLINLIDNAAKYTPEGGQIWLRTKSLNDSTWQIIVKDNGAGILPEDRPHIFDRFYKAEKAHTSGKGTGLGLAICRMILEKHGQKIELLPSQEGSIFAFTLEKSQSSAEKS